MLPFAQHMIKREREKKKEIIEEVREEEGDNIRSK